MISAKLCLDPTYLLLLDPCTDQRGDLWKRFYPDQDGEIISLKRIDNDISRPETKNKQNHSTLEEKKFQIHMTKNSQPVLRIRDDYLGSRIQIFSIQGKNISRSRNRICIKEFKYFNPKALGNMIRDGHSGSGSWFFTHPGSRIQGSKRHRI